MSRILLIALRLASLSVYSSCGTPATTGAYPGEPLVSLRGQLSVEAGRSIPETAKLAIAWFAPTSPWPIGPALASTSWPEIYSAPYPSHFEVHTYAPPPPVALGDLSQTSGAGVGAEGVLVAYQDGNSNGVLDLVGDGETSPDIILGSALGDLSQQRAGSGYRLIYLDGAPPTDVQGFQQGYNLVHTSQGVVAFSTEIPMVLSGALDLQPLLCRTRAPDGGTVPCVVQTAPAPLKIVGSIGIAQGAAAVNLSVEDARGLLTTATIAINGQSIPYNSSKQRYSLFESENMVLSPNDSNQISVRAMGYADLDVIATLPGQFDLTAPAFNAQLQSGEPVSLSWNASAKAARYRVRVFDQSFAILFEGRTTELSFTTGPIVYSGAATVNVQAEIDEVPSVFGSFILPYVNTGRPVIFQ